MSGAFERACALFVAPAGAAAVPERARPAARPPAITAVGVLHAGADPWALGCAIAERVRRACRVRSAVVVAAGAPPAGSGAWPAASRLAARLARRELTCTPAGRLVRVGLGEHDVESSGRLQTAVGDVPLITVVPGPRSAATDALLASQDLVVVAIDRAVTATLAELLTGTLDELGVVATTCTWSPPLLTRALARRGLVALRADALPFPAREPAR